MKTALTNEQSKRLIELGVEPKFQYRLTDLLSLLPKEIDGDVLCIISTKFNPEMEKMEKGWTATYVTDHFISAFGDDTIFSAPELIDSLYQLAIWVIENGHLNQKKQ